MKNNMLSLMLLLLCSGVWANPSASIIPSTIRGVTVYRTGAQVFRSGESRIPAGQSILKFSELSANLSPASIQFNATGAFTILSVNFQRNYINPLEHSDEAKTIQAQIKTLDLQLRKQEVDLQVLQEEEALLLANKQIGGQQSGVQLADLKAIAEYYRSRLKEIKLQGLTIEQEKATQYEEKGKLQRQLAEITTRLRPKASGEVWVTVTAEQATTTKFQLSYMVPNAGWEPAYDVRVADIGEDVELYLKGNVYQSSGENWTGVTMSLSTGIPMEGGVKPTVQPWWLAPNQPVVNYQARDKLKSIPIPPEPDMDMDMVDLSMEAPPAVYAAVEQLEHTTTREYRITLPYDVPSDGKSYTVSIERYQLPAEYQYYVAPKYDLDAFLTAKVSGWDDYHLLSGPANLFFGDSYLGVTQLNVQQTTDTLELSLGRDKGIIVSRTKDEQFKDRQFIGKKVTQKIGWTVELRNSKSKAVQILVEDQYPISTTDEIEIALNNAKGARVEKEAGKLSWKLELQPRRSETLHFQYEVKYPKRMNLVLE